MSRRRNSEETAVLDCMKMLRKHDTHTLPSFSRKPCTFPQLQGELGHLNGSMSMPLETIASVDALETTTESEVKELIQKCRTDVNYEILFDTELSDPCDAPDALSKLIGMVRQNLLSGMGDEFYTELLDMLRVNVFHETYRVDKKLIYADAPVKFEIRNARRLQLAYELLQVSTQLVSHLIVQSDIDGLLRVFESPVPSEQTMALTALEYIVGHVPNFTEPVVKHIMVMIQRYRDGCLDNHCVLGPSFRFLTRHYNSRKLEPADISLFKSMIYPTFLSEHAAFFSKELTQLSLVFQMHEITVSLWCFKFLVKHWPKSSAVKEVVFLQQLRALLSTIPASMLPIIQKKLFQTLSECIASPNYRVSLCAMEICADELFVKTLADIAQPVARILEESLEEALTHWNDCVKANAQKLMRILSAYFGPPTRRGIQSSKKALPCTWKYVLQLANENASSIPVVDIFRLEKMSPLVDC